MFYRLVIMVVVVWLACSLCAPAAEPSPEAAAKAAAEQYGAVRERWETVNKKLDALVDEFRAADAARREEIKKDYIQLVEEANGLLPQLRQTAKAAYKAAPNQDPLLVRLLVGLAANDVRLDRYDDAMELASLLIDHECPEKAIYGMAGIAAYCRDQFPLAQTYLTKAQQANVLPEIGMMCLTDAPQAEKLWAKEQELRRAEAQADDLPRVVLKTTKGEIVVELFENEAPQTVANFISLVERGFYDGLTFHRVLPGFMAQAGCPKGDGTGGPGYHIYCECYADNHRNHFRGSLSMAHAGRDTGGSQFFITFRRTSHLDGRHTVFGRVIQGMDVLAKLQRRDPQRGAQPEPDKIVEAKVLRKRNHEYRPTKVP